MGLKIAVRVLMCALALTWAVGLTFIIPSWWEDFNGGDMRLAGIATLAAMVWSLVVPAFAVFAYFFSQSFQR